MSLKSRVEELERKLAEPATDRRDILAMHVMAVLTIGGLSPDDPGDTIERRYRAGLESMGLEAEPADDARIAHIRAWYQRGVVSAGWRADG